MSLCPVFISSSYCFVIFLQNKNQMATNHARLRRRFSARVRKRHQRLSVRIQDSLAASARNDGGHKIHTTTTAGKGMNTSVISRVNYIVLFPSIQRINFSGSVITSYCSLYCLLWQLNFYNWPLHGQCWSVSFHFVGCIWLSPVGPYHISHFGKRSNALSYSTMREILTVPENMRCVPFIL